MSATAYIALGSNRGDRRAYLDQALDALRQRPGIAVTKVSSYHETEPVGGPPGQGKYLNAAAELQTDLPPRELLQALLDIEQSLGRVRIEQDAPRTIDLDLLLHGDMVVNEPDLVVPHPRMHERPFVLLPLEEIAPQAMHPIRKVTVTEEAEHDRLHHHAHEVYDALAECLTKLNDVLKTLLRNPHPRKRQHLERARKKLEEEKKDLEKRLEDLKDRLHAIHERCGEH